MQCNAIYKRLVSCYIPKNHEQNIDYTKSKKNKNKTIEIIFVYIHVALLQSYIYLFIILETNFFIRLKRKTTNKLSPVIEVNNPRQ